MNKIYGIILGQCTQGIQSAMKDNEDYNQTIIVKILSCHIVYTNYNKPHQGNKARFPQDTTGPHWMVDQEISIKIN